MSNQLRKIKALCLDFDGVFYPCHHIPDMHENVDIIHAQTASALFKGQLSFDDALVIASEGYKNYGDCITALALWAKENGIAPEDFRDRFFKLFHQNMHERLQQTAPKVFTYQTDLVSAFAKTSDNVKKGIATHGCADNWVRPLLKTMGISEFIDPDAIFSLNDSGFVTKSTDPLLVRMCFNAMSTAISRGGFVEDTMKNLETAKEHHPKLTTILITQGASVKHLPNYVDFQFKNLAEMNLAIHAAHKAPR
ncbi:MAG: hypothetical protein AAB276_00020 [Pseudomonadota bacterium]